MDRRLVIRAQEGDRAAFAELAVAVGDRLHAVAYRMLRDASLAEDASQQTLMQAWTQAAQAARSRPLLGLVLPIAGECLPRRVAEAQASARKT